MDPLSGPISSLSSTPIEQSGGVNVMGPHRGVSDLGVTHTAHGPWSSSIPMMFVILFCTKAQIQNLATEA